MDAAITEAAALRRDLPHGFPDEHIIEPNAAISHARPINGQDRTRPALARIMLFADMGHRIPLCAGRHHFFDATFFKFFKMALSSIASAKSFFSLAFSSSKAFSFRASETSMPPYFALYL